MVERVVASVLGFVVLALIIAAAWDLDSEGPGGAPG
jgi:hypothetical protein